MPRISAEDAARRAVTRAAASVTAYEQGIDAVTESPMAKAADNISKMQTNFDAAIASGKTEAALRAIPLGEWQRLAKAKSGNWATGLSAAEAKLAAAYRELFPQMQTLQDQVAAMADATLEDSIARASAWIRGMAALGS